MEKSQIIQSVCCVALTTAFILGQSTTTFVAGAANIPPTPPPPAPAIVEQIPMPSLQLNAFTARAANPTNAQAPIRVDVNGTPIAFPGQTPVMVNGRVLVPARGVFETLGWGVDWDADTRTVTISSVDGVIVLRIGDTSWTKNGQPLPALDVPAQIINGSTMIPLRAVGEATGANVQWVPRDVSNPLSTTDVVMILGTVTSLAHAIPTVVTPPPPVTTPVTGWQRNVREEFRHLEQNRAYEQELFALINEYRASRGIATLSWSEGLAMVGREHALDPMRVLEHIGSDGSSPEERVLRAINDGRVKETIRFIQFIPGHLRNDGTINPDDFPFVPDVVENIAGGFPTPASVLRAWQDSPGHRGTLIRFRSGTPAYIGVGFESGRWVLLVAARG